MPRRNYNPIAYKASTYSQEKADMFFKRLKGTEGNVRLATKSLGLSATTIYSWRRSYPEFDKKFREVRGIS